MAVEVRRFDVFLIALDPTVGHEIKKTRPCVVISPDEMNRNIGTVIVAVSLILILLSVRMLGGDRRER